jgi:hypothetical protein
LNEEDDKIAISGIVTWESMIQQSYTGMAL